MQAKRGPYGGDVAAILWSSFSPYAGLVGLACATVLYGLTRLFSGSAAERLLPLLCFSAGALFVVRVALQSAFGRHDAGLFRNDGSTWTEAFLALGRVLALNLVWLLPILVAVRDIQSFAAHLVTGRTAGPGVAALLLAVGVLPPLFLITSVAATRFADVFTPGHWRATFSGRAADVLMLVAVALGGALTGSAFVYLLAFGLGNGRVQAMVALGVLAGFYSLGMFLLLVGRLVGGFVRTAESGAELADATPPQPAAHAVVPDHDRRQPAERAAVDLPPVPEPARRPGLANIRPAPVAGVTSAVDVALREKLFQSLGQAGQPPRTSGSGGVAVPAMPPGMAATAAPGAVRAPAPIGDHAAPVKGQLATASVLELLRANERTARTEPQRALDEIAEALAGRGRHPQLLARMAVLEAQLHRPQAIHTAKDAAQLACSMGNHGAVAELLEPFRAQLDELALSADDWVKVAHAQKGLRHLDQAAALYQRVLGAAPRNLAAIKGLVQIADDFLKQDAADQALAIYDYLDGQCAGHPFREFTDRGRELAERKLMSTR